MLNLFNIKENSEAIPSVQVTHKFHCSGSTSLIITFLPPDGKSFPFFRQF